VPRPFIFGRISFCGSWPLQSSVPFSTIS
jgi:hypothetical protein